MSRRELVLDSAIGVLGRDGLRALTHRTVDREAALPEGSTSNLFRTRDALLDGVAERLAERDLELWGELVGRPVRDREELIEVIAVWCERVTGPEAALTAARYALFLAARNRPSLGATLTEARRGLEEWGAALLSESGEAVAPARIAEIFDQLDGLLLHKLCFPESVPDLRAALRRLFGG